MAKIDIECECSNWKLKKGKGFTGKQRATKNVFDKCECIKNGKRISKKDNIKIDINVSTKKGFAAF